MTANAKLFLRSLNPLLWRKYFGHYWIIDVSFIISSMTAHRLITRRVRVLLSRLHAMNFQRREDAISFARSTLNSRCCIDIDRLHQCWAATTRLTPSESPANCLPFVLPISGPFIKLAFVWANMLLLPPAAALKQRHQQQPQQLLQPRSNDAVGSVVRHVRSRGRRDACRGSASQDAVFFRGTISYCCVSSIIDMRACLRAGGSTAERRGVRWGRSWASVDDRERASSFAPCCRLCSRQVSRWRARRRQMLSSFGVAVPLRPYWSTASAAAGDCSQRHAQLYASHKNFHRRGFQRRLTNAFVGWLDRGDMPAGYENARCTTRSTAAELRRSISSWQRPTCGHTSGLGRSLKHVGFRLS